MNSANVSCGIVNDEISVSLLPELAKQINLSVIDFRNLIEFSISAFDY